MARAEKTIEVAVPRDYFYRCITEFERYPEILKDVTEAQVLESEGAHVRAFFRAKAAVRFHYTIDITLEPPTGLHWTLVHSDALRRDDGGWKLEEIGPERTRVTFWMDVGIGILLPRFVVNRLLQFSFPSMLRQWKTFAEKSWQAERPGQVEPPDSRLASGAGA